MPIVEVNGQELEFPDSMGSDEIKTVLQKKFPKNAQEATPQKSQVQTTAARTVLDQGLQGIPFVGTFTDEAAGVLGGLGAKAYDKITGNHLFDNQSVGEVVNQGIDTAQKNVKNELQQRPVLSVGTQLASGILTGGAAASTKAGAAVTNSIRSGNIPARIIKGGIAGAASGGLYGAGAAEEGERLQNAGQSALVGAGIGAAIPATGAAVGAVKDAFVPVIDDAIKPLAQRARDFGISLRADQVAPTRVRNTVQKISQELPFSGVDKGEALQAKQFTSAVAKTIGQDAENLSPETIKNFRKDVGEKFNNVLSGKEVTVSPEDLQGIEAIKAAARKNIETGLADVVDTNVDDVLKDLQSGKLSGEKLASIRSEMLKTSTRAQGGASEFIGDIVDSIDNIAGKNISPEEAQSLAQARTQWRNFRTIQPLLEKSTDGTINATQLINRVASSRFIDASNKAVGEDDLVDLARIGKEFLSKKGGSDTFQKAALGTGAVSAITGAFANPLLTLQAAAATGGVLATNRLGQAVNSSQRLIDAALKSRGSALPLVISNTPANPLIAGVEAR